MYFFVVVFVKKELISFSLFFGKKMLLDILLFRWDYVSFLTMTCLNTKIHFHIYKINVKTDACCICGNEICRKKVCLTIITV